MLTFSDHNSDAPQAAEAVRALAHATIRLDHDDEPQGRDEHNVEHPEDTYRVFGNVLAIVRSLSQVVQQIGAAHDRNVGLAHTDDGSAEEGRAHVTVVHQAVLDAQLALERAHFSLDIAMSSSGKVAWYPPRTVEFSAGNMSTAVGQGPAEEENQKHTSHRTDPASATRRASGGPRL